MGTKSKQRPKWLCWVELWFNTSCNASTQTTSFKALYGQVPPTLLKGDIPTLAVEEVNNLIVERNLILGELKWQLTKAQDRTRNQLNKKRREVEYMVGDMVYLKIIWLKSLATRTDQKLSPQVLRAF